jgi:RHS repeat-associated protein
MTVTSADEHSLEIAFPTLNGVTAYDPVGRERQRREFTDGEGPVALLHSYDGLGQLTASQNLQLATNTTQADRAFAYDPLRNITTQADLSTGNPGSVSMTYKTPDLDRICGVGYGQASPPALPACNLTYDGAGNTLTMPTRTGSTRTLEYHPNGAVKRITDGASVAIFAYDAFGGLQRLILDTLSADRRLDKYFGSFIKQRIEGSQSVIDRQIAVPGVVATLHGPLTGKWTFALGEGRGTRFVTDQDGNRVQTDNYQPFGEVKDATGATPGTTNYTSELFNGGDLLAAFGVVNLGARIYDPAIGRFLSRDAIIGKNPYAFASNDPVNRADPTGLDDEELQGRKTTESVTKPGSPQPQPKPPSGCGGCKTAHHPKEKKPESPSLPTPTVVSGSDVAGNFHTFISNGSLEAARAWENANEGAALAARAMDAVMADLNALSAMSAKDREHTTNLTTLG